MTEEVFFFYHYNQRHISLSFQVIQDKVHHIEDWPLYPEAFYEASGTELRPQPVGDELGRVVYQYYPTSSVNYVSCSGNEFFFIIGLVCVCVLG